MRKRFIAAPIVALVGLAMVVPVTSAARTKLTWWDPYGPPFGKVAQRIIDDFNKSQDSIFVTRQVVDGNSMIEKLALTMMAGKGPDMAHVWRSSSACELWARGLTRSMDEYITRDKDFWSQVYPAFMEGLRFRGKQLGFPDAAQADMLYWNTGLFSQAGLDPDKAPAFDDIALYAAKLTRKRADGKLEICGFNPVNTWSGYPDWAYLFGGQFFDKAAERVTANTEANLKALTWLTGFVKTYGGPAALSAPGMFEQGKVGMLLGHHYVMKNISASKRKVAFNIGLPPAPGGLQADRGPMAGLDCNIVLRGTKHPDAAYRFLKYFISRGGWMQPDTPDPSPYRTLNEKFVPPPVVPEGTWKPVALRVLDFARPPLSMPGAVKYMADLTALVDQAYQGKKSPQQVLTEAQFLGEKHFKAALGKARWGK